MPDELRLERVSIQAGKRLLVDGVSLSVTAGRLLALVGESGSGKTLTARSCMGLVRPKPGVVTGSLQVEVGDQLHAPYEVPAGPAREARFKALRGRIIGYLPQDARASLVPLWTVRRQVREVIQLRKAEGGLPEGGEHPEAWLGQAGFAYPEDVMGLYPHELSGGMAQRVCIALTLARGSRFIIADEPTTGLDPTVQSGILARVRALKNEGIGVILITHDLRIVPDLADEVAVMHEGRIVDLVPAHSLGAGRSKFTYRLLEATARIAGGLL